MYLADANLHVHSEEIKIDKTLCFVEEPEREVKSLKRSKIPIVKVHWNLKRGHEDFIKSKYPHLVIEQAIVGSTKIDWMGTPAQFWNRSDGYAYPVLKQIRWEQKAYAGTLSLLKGEAGKEGVVSQEKELRCIVWVVIGEAGKEGVVSREKELRCTVWVVIDGGNRSKFGWDETDLVRLATGPDLVRLKTGPDLNMETDL
nr:putative reverse transcriptase domain-containing protein [Tanacetum cinerariifolium]